MANSFNSNIDTLLGKLENFVATKTVVGEAIHLDGVILLPLVEVSFGAGAGAKDSTKEKETAEASGPGATTGGGVGGGVGGRITPSAVIAVVGGNVQLINIKNQDSISKLIDMFPGILTKLNIGGKSETDKKPED
jgi:uncharacterized spore protein YtfJ